MGAGAQEDARQFSDHPRQEGVVLEPAHAALDAVEQMSVLQAEINALRAENKALKSKLRALRQLQEYNASPPSRGCCDDASTEDEGAYDA